MADQLALILEPHTKAEAQRRGLDVGESVTVRDHVMVGIVGGAFAHLRRALEEAADNGFEVTVSVLYQDRGDAPKCAVVRGRIERLAVNVKV